MEHAERIPISDFVESSLLSFGTDVNNNRQLPNLYDGLKPAYRRIIYTAMELGNITKSVTISGTCISKYHPHGDASLIQPISNLVNCGILNGNGNHGMKKLRGDNLGPAAPRYTEAGISEKWKNIFKDLIKYVPFVPSELEGYTEPEYLPTPIPLCFLTGTLGIGFGVNTRVPVFSCDSMIRAYYEDDPELLEPSIDIELIHDESELKELWTRGIGKLTYKFKCEWGNSPSGRGIYISGDPTLFKPNLSLLERLAADGKIFMNDETDKNSQKLFIARNYNVKSLNLDKLMEYCQQASINSRVYRLTVSDGGGSYLIPLKEWIGVTINNYLRLVDEYKSDMIGKHEFDKKIYENLPRVADYLFNHRDTTNEEICKALNLEKDIVSAILSKSINTLKNTETKSRILSIEEKLKEYKSLNPEEYLTNIVSKLTSN